LKQLEAERAGMERDLSRRELAVGQARREAEARLIELERGVKEARAAQEELQQAQTQLSAASASLASGDFAAAERDQLLTLHKEIEALGYDEEARRQAYSQEQELRPFAEKLRRLSDAEASLPREEESASQTGEILQRASKKGVGPARTPRPRCPSGRRG
jgi:hypothetical protein